MSRKGNGSDNSLMKSYWLFSVIIGPGFSPRPDYSENFSLRYWDGVH